MASDVLLRINWVDILIAVIFVRLLLNAVRNGIAIELFKLCGTLLAFFISLHYFASLTDVSVKAFGIKSNIEMVDQMSLVFLAAVSYGAILGVRFALIRTTKRPEEIDTPEQLASACVAVARAILVSALVIFGTMVTRVDYFEKEVKTSFVGPSMLSVSSKLYESIWDTVWSKASGNEKPNNLVFKIAGSA